MALAFGVIAVYLMGGPIGLITPIFVNPLGLLVSLVLIVIAFIVFYFLTAFGIAILDSPRKSKKIKVD